MKNFNMMKKLLALTLGAAMLLAVMTGCGKKDTAQEPADDQQQQQEEQQPAEPATLLEQIKAKGKVVVGTEAQYAPYEFKDLDANFAGCDMWLAQQIADSLGVELEVVDMAFDGIIPAVQSGQVDLGIAAFTNTPERAEEIDFSDLYETSAQLLIVKAGNADTYSTKESLAGLKVGAQKGTIQSQLIQSALPESELFELEKYPALALEVQNGNIAGLVVDQAVGEALVATSNGALEVSNFEFSAEEASFGKSVVIAKGNEDLVDTVLGLRPDLVVNDFLNTGTAYMERLRAGGARCVNFEDEGPGAELAQLVVNALYESGQSTERLRCGPDYFCLRDEFVGAARNPLRPETRTVLITFGGTDQRDCSRRVLDIIEPICRAYGIAIRLVAGPGYAHKEAMEAHLRALENPLVSFTWATNVMSRMMEGADLAVCSAGRTVYELAHMRVPGMVLAHHEREARHTFARPRNGFAFMGLMDRVDDVKIRNVFLAMLKQTRRARFWERQNRLDFTANKARVVGLMLGLLDKDGA